MNEEKVIQKIITIEEKVTAIQETMITRVDHEKHTVLLENIVTIVKKIQEDHVFAVEWLKRLQARVDQQDEEIRRIKLQLKMA